MTLDCAYNSMCNGHQQQGSSLVTAEYSGGASRRHSPFPSFRKPDRREQCVRRQETLSPSPERTLRREMSKRPPPPSKTEPKRGTVGRKAREGPTRLALPRLETLPAAGASSPPAALSSSQPAASAAGGILPCGVTGCGQPSLGSEGVCEAHHAASSSPQSSSTKGKHPRCRQEGCKKQAVRGGVCISHGAVVKYNRCKTPGCQKYARSQGVCVQHGAKSPRCRVEGCMKQAVQKGICIGHGARVSYKRCAISGCHAHANNTIGLCGKHQTPDRYVQCGVTDCPRYAKINGRCLEHQKQLFSPGA